MTAFPDREEHEPTAHVIRLLLALEAHAGWMSTKDAGEAAGVERNVARRILRELAVWAWTQGVTVDGKEVWAIGPALVRHAERYEQNLLRDAAQVRARWAILRGEAFLAWDPAATRYEPSTETPTHKATAAVCEVLTALFAHLERPLSTTAVRELVGLHRDTLTAILAELAAHGFVDLDADDLGDRWRAGIALPRVGRAFLRAAERQAAETGRQFAATLGPLEAK